MNRSNIEFDFAAYLTRLVSPSLRSCRRVLATSRNVFVKASSTNYCLERIYDRILQWRFIFLFLLFPSPAAAQTSPNDQVEYQNPSVRLVQEGLISTSAMQAYFQNLQNACGASCRTDVAPLPEALYPIKSLADALARKDPTAADGDVAGLEFDRRVFEYVRNNIKTEFRFGLAKGALGALIDKSGTPFDQVALMSALLSERGVTGIAVKAGTVTLSGAEIADRFGTTDPIVLCKMLANGGIAADIALAAGSMDSSCTSTGSIASVTMAHAWLVVGGVAYDPARKKVLVANSPDFATRMGCAQTCGSTVAGVLPTPSTGAVPAITGVNEYGVNGVSAKLQQFATAALNDIRASSPNDSTWTIIGQDKVDAKPYLVGDETPPTPNEMFSFQSVFSDPFRTKITLQYNGMNVILFGDDVYARRLWIDTTLNKSATTTITATIFLDKALVNSVNVPVAQNVTSTTASTADFPLQLTIKHPYPNALHKANQSFSQMALPRALIGNLDSNRNISWPRLNIIYGAGETAPQMVEQIARLGNLLQPAMDHSQFGNANLKPDILTDAALSSNQFLAQESRAFALLARLQNVAAVKHYSLGFVASPTLYVPISTTTSVSSAYSAIERNLSQAKVMAFSGALGAISSMIEGSVAQQAEDGWEAGSGVSLISRANEKNIPFYYANATNLTAALNLTSGYSQEQKNSITNYVANYGFEMIVPRDGSLGSFVTTTVCPPATSCSNLAINVAYGSTLGFKPGESAYLVGGRFKGAGAAGRGFDPVEGALSAAKQTSLSLANQIKPTISMATGGMTLSPPPDVVAGWAGSPGALTFQRTFDGTSSSSLTCRISRESLLPINPIPGTSPSPFHVGRCAYDGADSSLNGHIGSGWVHNHQLAAEIGNSAMPMLGDHSAEASVPTLTAFQVLLQLHETQSFRNVLAGAFVAKWLGDRFINNTVNLTLGSSKMQFVRAADNPSIPADPSDQSKWIPPLGTGAKLFLAGARTGPAIADGAVRFDYRNISIIYVSPQGEEIEFFQPNKTNPTRAPTVSAPAVSVVLPRFSATRRIGVGNVNFVYVNQLVVNRMLPTTDFLLRNVVSSTGNILRFGILRRTGDVQLEPGYPIAEHYLISRVWNDENANIDREINEPGVVIDRPLTLTPIPASYGSNPYYFDPDFWLGSPYLTVAKMNEFNNVNAYGYPIVANNPKVRYVSKSSLDCAASTDPVATSRILEKISIKRICSGGGPELSRITTESDGLYRTVKVTDALSNNEKVFVGGTGGEALLRSERVMPPTDGVTGVQTAWFSDRGDLVKDVDPLGRTSINQYDDAHRLIRAIQPEGNATEFEYDIRGNLIRECKISKGRVNWSIMAPATVRQLRCDTNQGDLVTSTTYVGTPSQRPAQCANMKTCNKPLFVTDPKGNRTDFDWSPIHGQLLKETRPPDSDGVRPETTYAYTAFTGVDAATFYLLTSKTEKVSATAATTTTYEYDTSNRFVLKATVVDAGGLNLRTCYKFDAVGNLISKTEPKAGLTACP